MGETMERRPEVVVKSADCSGIRGHGKVGDGAPQQFGERACGRASERGEPRPVALSLQLCAGKVAGRDAVQAKGQAWRRAGGHEVCDSTRACVIDMRGLRECVQGGTGACVPKDLRLQPGSLAWGSERRAWRARRWARSHNYLEPWWRGRITEIGSDGFGA